MRNEDESHMVVLAYNPSTRRQRQRQANQAVRSHLVSIVPAQPQLPGEFHYLKTKTQEKADCGVNARTLRAEAGGLPQVPDYLNYSASPKELRVQPFHSQPPRPSHKKSLTQGDSFILGGWP